MAHGSWAMSHGLAMASGAGSRVPGLLGSCWSWSWTMSQGPWGISHDAPTILRRWINQLRSCELIVSSAAQALRVVQRMSLAVLVEKDIAIFLRTSWTSRYQKIMIARRREPEVIESGHIFIEMSVINSKRKRTMDRAILRLITQREATVNIGVQ